MRIRVKSLLGSDQGFALIELLVVVVVLGILLAIAVPMSLSSKDRANKSVAQANVRAALPDVESYNTDNSGYSGMTVAILKAGYDQAFPSGVWVNTTDTGPGLPTGVTGVAATATNYCVVSQNGNWYAWKLGPDGILKTSSDPAAVCL